MDAVHLRQVDDEAAVVDGVARDVVTAAPDGEDEAGSRAKLTASTTSAAPVHGTISAGRDRSARSRSPVHRRTDAGLQDSPRTPMVNA
jgi:hypothetical protein